MAVYDPLHEEGMVRVFPAAVARGAKVISAGFGPGVLSPELSVTRRADGAVVDDRLVPMVSPAQPLQVGPLPGTVGLGAGGHCPLRRFFVADPRCLALRLFPPILYHSFTKSTLPRSNSMI